MDQKKFTLADVILLIATIAFGFVCYMGADFLNINNDNVWRMSHTVGCIVVGLTISALLFGTAYGAKLLKHTRSNFKTSFIWEMICLTLFIILAAFFTTKYSPFTHFFTVTAQRSEINSKLQNSIDQAEKMFIAYESYADNRENLYKHKLQSVVASKGINPQEYKDYGFLNNGIADDKQIKNKMFKVHADLFPTNYTDALSNNGIKEVATKWFHHARTITNSWNPISITSITNNVENKANEWHDKLVDFSKILEKGEQTPAFEYSFSFSDVKTHFSNLDLPTLPAIGFAILAYILMLFSWFVTNRKHPIDLKRLFGTGKPLENEL